MSREQIHDYTDRLLLTVGTGSWIGMFQAVSDFFKLLLPITGFISFCVYLLINRKKIIEAWKNWTGRDKSNGNPPSGSPTSTTC